MVLPVNVSSIGQFELFNRLTVCKRMTYWIGLIVLGILETFQLCANKWVLTCLKCCLQTMYLQNHIYPIDMYKGGFGIK